MADHQIDASYGEHVAALERRLNADQALRVAVGGEFVAMGKLEFHLLRSLGLQDGQLVVDIGCGSGRLAAQLAGYRNLRYVGTDVVPRLLEYARELCRRPDWTFTETTGTTIPAADGAADFACFFSVFTHLTQEEIFRYIREAHRVLKPGGRLVASFLEFRVGLHWQTFADSVDGVRENRHLNQFVEREALAAWAAHAGFAIQAIHGGDTAYIPLSEEVRFDDGRTASGAASLGQSVVVMEKRAVKSDVPDARQPEPAANGHLALTDEARRVLAPAARPNAPLVNLAVRATVPTEGAAIVGFIVGGTVVRRLLLRAIGPSLALHGVTQFVEHPTLELHAGGKMLPDSNPPGDLSGLLAAVGAWALVPGTKDVSRVVLLPPGAYSAVVQPAYKTPGGEILFEAFVVD